MALYLKKISETTKSKVYTEDGYFLGEIEDAMISGNKIYGWKLRVLDPNLNKRGIRGLIIQHQLVKAMGQIWIVSRAVYSVKSEEETPKEEKKETTEQQQQTTEQGSNIEIEKIE